MKFKTQMISTLAGLAGLFAPSVILNSYSGNQHPGVVWACVSAASLVGFGFGVWTVVSIQAEESQDIEA